MYAGPTPFALAEGTAHCRTLILPAAMAANDGLIEIGHFSRREVYRVVVACNLDLRSRELTTNRVPNPAAGKEHAFKTLCPVGDLPRGPIVLRERSRGIAEHA